MGGIFGVICKDRIPKNTIYEGLRRLLYRGYDGAGVAYLDENLDIVVRKAPGHLDSVSKKVDLRNIPSNIALGHTRYANRGWPNEVNTHPLLDCTGKVAVVGDGFIENYEVYKKKLVEHGHKYVSTTDMEVYAHIIEDNVVKEGRDPLEALALAARDLHGVYAIACLVSGRERIYALQMGQPLVIGIRGDKRCIYLSSDIPSLYGFADEALVVGEHMAVEIGVDSIRVVKVDDLSSIDPGQLVKKRVKYPVEYVGKAGYPHYMLKEIFEIPDAIVMATYSVMEKYLRLAAMITYGARNVYVIGNGTSLHAGMVSSYYFTELARINVNVVSAAEFPYYALENVTTGTVVIAISQSGETSDVIRSVKLAKMHGAVIIGVTNVVGSRLALESNVYLPIGAGPEIAVPATKTFTSSLAVLLLLAGYTGLYTGVLQYNEYRELVENIRGYASDLKKEIERYYVRTKEVAEKLYGCRNAYVSSSGINYPIALEGALKLKEASIIHAEGVQLGELRHGPLVLVGGDYPVIIIKPVEEQALELYSKTAQEILSKKGRLVTITQDEEGYGELVKVMSTNKLLSPLTTIIPLQLLAYNLGVKYGRPIDTPPGLAKAITT